ncbi:PH domain-containing protein [Massiliimalia massiliensis]|uniref:PH domain-containing protein n=1 Tax=Massiliimalia massiliensis TaxID=1852384 RepID=UPI0009866F5E|nr:PH domain-containing protein [Massiliimalia massiliensis]MBS1473448.1 PH domain-containing protein [Massiliimalia sp.]
MKAMRSHPINILENTSRFLILLLLPLLRALIIGRMGFYEWLSGAWFDLLIVALIIALGVYGWYSYTFTINEAGIHIFRGVIVRQSRFLAFGNITAISVESPWYYRPIKAVRLQADTDGGETSQPDFSITVKRELAEMIMEASRTPLIPKSSFFKTYIPRNLYITIFSLLTSNSLTGVLYLWAALSQAEKVFGKPFRNELLNTFTQLAELNSFGLPPVFAIIAYIILGCWLFSFLRNMEQHLRFQTTRYGNALGIQSGLFTIRRYSISVPRINFLTLRQSLFSKLFGITSVFIHCTGYGKKKDELAVLLPSGLNQEIKSNLNLLLPEIPFVKKQIKPKIQNLSRFLIPPLTLCLCVLAAGLLALYFITGFDRPLIFVLVICEIPCLWWLTVKTFAYFHTGIGVSEEAVTIYYTRLYQIISCSIPKDKITKIALQQTLFQIPTKCCDVHIYTWAEGTKRQRVLNMYLPEVLDLLAPEAFFELEKEKEV